MEGRDCFAAAEGVGWIAGLVADMTSEAVEEEVGVNVVDRLSSATTSGVVVDTPAEAVTTIIGVNAITVWDSVDVGIGEADGFETRLSIWAQPAPTRRSALPNRMARIERRETKPRLLPHKYRVQDT